MTIYSIHGFDEGPHWEAAYIEAESESEARTRLREYLEQDRSETIWERQPEEQWTVSAVDSPLMFVLGAGCR